MSNYPAGRRPRSADPHSKLRLAALTAVVVGVLLLAAAAFVLSYSGIHQVTLQTGVSPGLAKLYPVIFDAMLVIAGAAAMALRGAGWWSRFYAWACLILLLAAVATGDAVHATATVLPVRAARAAVAVTPWVLVLLAFGLLLTMLRHFRKARTAAVQARQAAMGTAESGAAGPGDAGEPAAGRALTWTGAGGAAGAAAGTLPQGSSGLVKLLEPRTGEPPAVEVPYDSGAPVTGPGEDTGQHDPVSYGEETGYVHPDSWDEGEYSPHGDSGGPGAYAAPGGHAGAGENGPDGAGTPAAAQEPANGAPANGAPVVVEGTAQSPAERGPAGEHAQDGATGEQPAAEEPGLERMWSTPSRPEE